MTNDSTKSSISQPASDTAVYLLTIGSIRSKLRDRVRGFIEAMIEGELDSALLRARYGRKPKLANEDADGSAGLTGHRHGHRSRSLMGTFGCVEIAVLRARINGEDGKTLEWKSKVLRVYQRRTVAADALIASTYLSGTNTRRVHRALTTLMQAVVAFGSDHPDERIGMPVRGGDDRRAGVAHDTAPYCSQGQSTISCDLEHGEVACGLICRAARPFCPKATKTEPPTG
jgi:hypothetical protein